MSEDLEQNNKLGAARETADIHVGVDDVTSPLESFSTPNNSHGSYKPTPSSYSTHIVIVVDTVLDQGASKAGKKKRETDKHKGPHTGTQI